MSNSTRDSIAFTAAPAAPPDAHAVFADALAASAAFAAFSENAFSENAASSLARERAFVVAHAARAVR